MARNTEKINNAHFRTCNMSRKLKKKSGKCEMHTLRPGIWQENLKNLKKGTQTMYYLEDSKKYWQTWNMRNVHCRTWNMARNLKKVKNETQTLYNMEHGRKYWKTWKKKKARSMTWICTENWKTWKMRNEHFRTWIMARNTKNAKNEKCTP